MSGLSVTMDRADWVSTIQKAAVDPDIKGGREAGFWKALATKAGTTVTIDMNWDVLAAIGGYLDATKATVTVMP